MHLRLITAKNRVLVNFEQTLEEAEIEDESALPLWNFNHNRQQQNCLRLVVSWR